MSAAAGTGSAAHLTIVCAALAVSRWIENQTGWSIIGGEGVGGGDDVAP
jgi:hypothetical protein